MKLKLGESYDVVHLLIHLIFHSIYEKRKNGKFMDIQNWKSDEAEKIYDIDHKVFTALWNVYVLYLWKWKVVGRCKTWKIVSGNVV